ncbi:hypothetical protein GCM10027431_00780 [Lysobacter rhizosphaerae]
MNNSRKILFAAALSALAGTALAAPPGTTPASSTTPANSTAPAKTTVTKHKHMAKAKKDVKSDKAPAASDAKKS